MDMPQKITGSKHQYSTGDLPNSRSWYDIIDDRFTAVLIPIMGTFDTE
jgi:hypothetical protein